jgi:hypothetical protein
MSYDLILKSTKALEATTRDSLFSEMRSASVLHGSDLRLPAETEGPDCHDLQWALDDGEVTEDTPHFPFPERLSNVYSALGEKANS